MRFRDTGERIGDFAGEDILVVCPRCSGRAVVSPDQVLTCKGCAYHATRSASAKRSAVWGLPCDPFFRRPLWLRARWRGHLVWAYHERHLAVLTEFVAADLRERGPGPLVNATMVSRLPRWMKTRHRAGLLKVLRRLSL